MKIQYDSEFIKQLQKANVRIRKRFKERIKIFAKDPYNLQLNNHPLKRKYKGYRSIDITDDYRVIYEEVQQGKDTITYFTAFGTHNQLYR